MDPSSNCSVSKDEDDKDVVLEMREGKGGKTGMASGKLKAAIGMASGKLKAVVLGNKEEDEGITPKAVLDGNLKVVAEAGKGKKSGKLEVVALEQYDDDGKEEVVLDDASLGNKEEEDTVLEAEGAPPLL